MTSRRILFTTLVLAVAAGGTGCRRKSPAPAPSASASGLPAMPATTAALPGYVLPRALTPFHFTPYKLASNLGIPAGCSLDEKVRSAPLPKGIVRFIAPPGATDELLVAVDEDADGTVDADGIVNADGAVGMRLPWNRMDEPPVVARSAAGYLVLAGEDAGEGLRQAVVFRESGRVERLATGDHLEVVDATCAGNTCAVLTSLASASAAPGASVFIGDPRGPLSAFTRVDVPGDEPGFRPFSVMRVGDGTASVALTSEALIEAVRVDRHGVTPLGRMESAFGAYDVVEGETPIAVAPGESIDDRCQKDGFPVKLLRPGRDAIEVDGQVPPTSVLTRTLTTGFIVAWLSPVSCRRDGHDFVRAFLLSRDGSPASSTMAVSNADGFALSSAGDRVNLVLAIDHELVWLRATCRAPGAKSER